MNKPFVHRLYHTTLGVFLPRAFANVHCVGRCIQGRQLAPLPEYYLKRYFHDNVSQMPDPVNSVPGIRYKCN